MMDAVIKAKELKRDRSAVSITVCFACEAPPKNARVSVIFEADGEDRRVPMLVRIDGKLVRAESTYDPAYIFYDRMPKRIRISFVFSDATDNGKRFDTDLVIDNIRKNRLRHFAQMPRREKKKMLAGAALNLLSLPFRALPIRRNKITFFSNRTSEPEGNLKAVLQAVREIENAEVHVVCQGGGARGTLRVLFRFLYHYMTSRVVFIDDYYHLISYVKKKKATKLIQLWHGCGAFKTFGFSRYHKDNRLQLSSPNHRQYDYAVVSAEEVAPLYAEAFGISSEKAVALGSPRCDKLTDSRYREEVRERFYLAHPSFRDKKILLFAPTFRGRGNGDCYYPTEQFRVDTVLEALGEDWAVIVKLHPYLKERFTCQPKNAKRFADCGEWDVNDLLFVTDFLVSDYSSVIFEASILDVPMAFLAFDLEEYIEKRDFYYDFESFVPGPIARTDSEIAAIAADGHFDREAVRRFRQRAFGETTGTACQNVRALTQKLIERE